MKDLALPERSRQTRDPRCRQTFHMGADSTRTIPHDDHRFLFDFEQKIITVFRDLAAMADPNPTLAPYPVDWSRS